jgi:hypothetical protein
MKPINRIFLCLVFLYLTSLVSFSQKNIKEGFIIRSGYDTVYGYIDYRGDIFNSTKCVFYAKPDSEPVTYLPGDIFAYRFTGDRYYISRHVKTDHEEKTVFLEYLVNGITSLYFLEDSYGEHFFIEKGNDLYELTNNVSIIQSGDDQYYKESNLYKGLLRVIYSDNQEIIPSINNARFDRSSMVSLSEKYHNLVCTDRECIIYEKSKKEVSLSFGPVIRIEKRYSTYREFLAPFKFSNSEIFMFGMAANLKLLSINEKMNIGIKAMVSKEVTDAYYSTSSVSWTEKNYLNYENIGFNTNFDLKYIYPRGKIRPAFGFGPEIGLFLRQKSSYLQQNYNSSGILVTEVKKKDFLHYNFELTVSVNAGFIIDLKKNTIFLELFFRAGTENYREYGTVIREHGKISYYSKLSVLGINTGFLF